MCFDPFSTVGHFLLLCSSPKGFVVALGRKAHALAVGDAGSRAMRMPVVDVVMQDSSFGALSSLFGLQPAL
jgi:hypothetical protein